MYSSEQELANNTSEQMAEDAVGECQRQLSTAQEQYQRLSADFDNYRRRIDREKAKISWDARARVLRGSLELVDTIDRAAESLEGQKAALVGFEGVINALQGIELLQKAALRFLEQQGVRPVGHMSTFDPMVHEAIAYGHDVHCAPGDIIEVFEKGYLLDNELLRPARVRVNESEASGSENP